MPFEDTEQKEIEQVDEKVEIIRQGGDIEFAETLRRVSFPDLISAGEQSAPTSNENASTTVPVGGGTVNHAATYDRRVIVDIDGTDYYIGLYLA